MTKILIIEDEEPIRRVLKKILSEENDDFKLFEAEDGKQGINLILEEDYDLILCDIKMPKMDGLEVLETSRNKGVTTPFIMLTGHGNVETAVHAMKNGAYDFIPKPPDLNRLLISVRNAIESKHLIKENVFLKKKIAKKYEIIGNSFKIKEVIEMIDKVAQTQARILITGQNGTGKELVANQIHQKSNRSKSPLIEVNCAAIPSELIESEKKIQEEMIKDSGKPSNVMEKILEGKMKKFYSEVTLLNQSFVIDNDKTVKDAISDFNSSNSLILKNYILISL